MKETGIIMSGNHPKLILDELKTMTRRTYGLEKINEHPDLWEWIGHDQAGRWSFRNKYSLDVINIKCPYGQVGDRLVIKETWATEKRYNHLKPSEIPDEAKIYYVNKVIHQAGGYSLFVEMGKVRSAMFMCNWMSRANPEITEVRVERLQEINGLDCIREGLLGDEYRTAPQLIGEYAELWDSLNAKRDHSWDKNEWVWPISFKVI